MKLVGKLQMSFNKSTELNVHAKPYRPSGELVKMALKRKQKQKEEQFFDNLEKTLEK
jgi:hypothetical protein